MIKPQNQTTSSCSSTRESFSSSSTAQSPHTLSLTNLANTLNKSCEHLLDLQELNYFPYNSCNSLTIYSYKYWKRENKYLVATKENSLKEIYFEEKCLTRSGSSSSSSSSTSTSSNSADERIEIKRLSADKEEQNDNEAADSMNYLEPVFKIHKFSKIKNCCKEFELDYMPHRVTHLKLITNNEASQQSKLDEKKFILVNCSNKTNLLYSIDIKNRSFKLIDKIEDYFIEFDHLHDNCTSHDIKYLNTTETLSHGGANANKKLRLTAIGCQNGWLGVFLVDSTKNEIVKYWENENDSYITQLKFFTTKCLYDWSKLDFEKVPINLLALRSLEPTRIFNSGYETHQDLEIPHTCDLVTSAVIYDATFCGYNSIVLGTFGKVLLFFVPTPVTAPSLSVDDLDKQMMSDLHFGSISGSETDASMLKRSSAIKKASVMFDYELKRDILFKHSILGVSTSIVSLNGAFDLVIFTLNGISVWQYDPEKVLELVIKKFEQREQYFIELLQQ